MFKIAHHVFEIKVTYGISLDGIGLPQSLLFLVNLFAIFQTFSQR